MISADWPINAIIACTRKRLHYQTLKFVDPLPFPHTNRKFNISTPLYLDGGCTLSQNRRKMYLQIIVTLR